MKRLVVLLLIGAFVGLVPVGCIDDDCGGFSNNDFIVQEMGIKTLNPESKAILDTSIAYPVDSIAKMIFVEEIKELTATIFTPISLFTSAAYACSPVIPYAKHKIIDIKIRSNSELQYADENDLIVINEDITGRFLIKSEYNYPNTFVPVGELIAEGGEILQEDRFFLKASATPFKTLDLGFDITIKMSDGAIFEFKNQVLKLK